MRKLGLVRVAISRDSIGSDGVNAPFSDIDADLRGAVVTAAARFAAATTDLEQTQQRAIIRFLMEAILGQHEFLTARVKGSEATLVKSTVTRQALADFSEAINKQTGPPLAG